MGLLPFFPNQHIVGQAIPGQNNAPDKALTAEGVVSGSQPYHQSVTNIGAGALRAGHAKQQNQLNQLKSTDTSLGVRNAAYRWCWCSSPAASRLLTPSVLLNLERELQLLLVFPHHRIC